MYLRKREEVLALSILVPVNPENNILVTPGGHLQLMAVKLPRVTAASSPGSLGVNPQGIAILALVHNHRCLQFPLGINQLMHPLNAEYQESTQHSTHGATSQAWIVLI